MKVLVIGLGSMGKRRIRLIQKYDSTIEIFGVDGRRDRCDEVKKKYKIETSTSIEDALSNHYLGAFISTSPLSHAELVRSCLERGIHVFTELNLVATMYSENVLLAKKNEKVLFLSSTLMYRKEIEYIKEKLYQYEGKVNYTYHVGQYLPDWHPWECYTDFFVGQKETSGCREFMAVEFPWLIDTFGKVKSFKVISDKMSHLKLEYTDNYLITFEHEGGNKGVVLVDVVARKAVRNLEVFGEEIFFTWNGTPEGLIWYDIKQKKDKQIILYETVDKNADYNSSIIEDAYYSEIVDFFSAIKNNTSPRYSYTQDLNVLKLIDEIEKIY